MLQKEMIQRFRQAFQDESRVAAALMFGSFTTGEGDEFSDIEFAVFIEDEALEAFDQRAWLDRVSPVGAYFFDDFGHRTALFENGIRGEFHFLRQSDIPIVSTWKGYAWFPSLEAAVLLDRSGTLSHHARELVGGPPVREGAALVEGLALNLISLVIFGANLLNRGEYARAWALLGKAHENLLKLVRLDEETTEHWPTPSRALEADLSAAAYERYLRCTAGASPVALCTAYAETWRWSLELFDKVAGPLSVELPEKVIASVDPLLQGALADATRS